MTTTDSRLAALLSAAADELHRRSFADYLRSLRVRGDDPTAPGDMPWQPWPHLMERAEEWEQRESEVILKARQLGYTWLVAAYMSWRARYHGWQCGYWSVGQAEARELLRRIEYIEQREHPADVATYPSGGRIVVFPSTEQAGISHTFQLAVMDELAFHPYGRANYSALRPTLSAGGQFLGLSTANPRLGQAGHFYELWGQAERGEVPYAPVFVPWHARPGRDDEWRERERAAFTGLPEEFDAYYPDSPAAAFVGKSGLVLPMFARERHVKGAPCAWEHTRARVAGVDWGGGDPTALVALGMTPQEHIHQYSEFYERGAVTIEQIAAWLFEWHRREPFQYIACGRDEPVATATLRGMGLPAYPADTARGEGLGNLAWLLERDRLTLDPSCVNSIAEHASYRWAERVDPHSRERYATSTPVDHHGDAMDARRYAVRALLKGLWRAPMGEPVVQATSWQRGTKASLRPHGRR